MLFIIRSFSVTFDAQNKNSEYCAPLTSIAWNEIDPNLVGTSSIDTTCTIWDLTAEQAKTQLIAHDREVFDLAWAQGDNQKDVFASVGADGSVRMFDLRSLEHSTIIYETDKLEPLLRLEWNKQDPNYLATFQVDSLQTIILDVRLPSTPVAEIGGHQGSINATAWAPHSACHLCTAGDDSQALIWDLSGIPKKKVTDPILAYHADGEINNLQWCDKQPDWISICFSDKLQIREYIIELMGTARMIGSVWIKLFLASFVCPNPATLFPTAGSSLSFSSPPTHASFFCFQFVFDSCSFVGSARALVKDTIICACCMLLLGSF